MTDLSNLSDEELSTLYNNQASTRPLSAWSDDELKAAYGRQKPAPDAGLDIAKQIGAGLVTGVENIPAAPAMLAGLAGKGVDYLANKFAPGMVSPDAQADQDKLKMLIASNRGEGIANYLPQAQTPAGEATRNVASFVPGFLGLGGSVARNALAGLAAGGASETLGQAYKGGPYEPYARAVGGVAGGYAGLKTAPGRAVAGVAGADVAKAADEGYAAVDRLGVELRPSAVNQAITNIAGDLGKAFDSDLAPKTFAVLNRDAAKYAAAEPDAMAALTGTQAAERAPVTTMDLDILRRRLGKVAQGADPTDASAAKIAQRQLDDFIQNVPPTDVLKGDAGELAKAAAEARGNYAAAARHEAFSNVIARAELNAARSNSGANVENSLRGEVKNFIRPDNRGASEASRSGFNDAEIALMEKFVRGGAGNTQRIVGNLLGGGGGMGATVATGVGHLFAGPAAIAAPAIGAAIKGAGNAAALRKAQNILDVILTRSPYAQQQPASLGAVPSRSDAALLAALQAARSNSTRD